MFYMYGYPESTEYSFWGSRLEIPPTSVHSVILGLGDNIQSEFLRTFIIYMYTNKIHGRLTDKRIEF